MHLLALQPRCYEKLQRGDICEACGRVGCKKLTNRPNDYVDTRAPGNVLVYSITCMDGHSIAHRAVAHDGASPGAVEALRPSASARTVYGCRTSCLRCGTLKMTASATRFGGNRSAAGYEGERSRFHRPVRFEQKRAVQTVSRTRQPAARPPHAPAAARSALGKPQQAEDAAPRSSRRRKSRATAENRDTARDPHSSRRCSTCRTFEATQRRRPRQ